MPKELLPMHKIEAVLELHHTQQLSTRKIAASLQLSKSTVSDYLKRAAAAGVPWPLPENWDESDLHAALFGSHTKTPPVRILPNWSYIHVELRKIASRATHDTFSSGVEMAQVQEGGCVRLPESRRLGRLS